MGDAVTLLRERLARHPAGRYPVQHATAAFHLGVALAGQARLEEAEAALRTANELFDARGLSVEAGKAQNGLGAVLRDQGRLEEAAECFRGAATRLASGGQGLEEGAARFNLGLVERQLGRVGEAVAQLRRARELLSPDQVPAHAGAAARELGGALLEMGDLETATRELEHAVALSDRAGDRAATGAAANALGLGHLAAGRHEAAVVALLRAGAEHPRSVRPEAFAMAKANLALAHERAGDASRARLAARQALGVREAPQPVLAQAAGILARLGPAADDVFRLLEQEPDERRAAVLREELALWAQAPPAERRARAGDWVHGQLERPQTALELAEGWLGALLELPPPAMEAVIRATLEALADHEPTRHERFRRQVSMGMARFHLPQWMRLKETFNRIAGELGQEPGWG